MTAGANKIASANICKLWNENAELRIRWCKSIANLNTIVKGKPATAKATISQGLIPELDTCFLIMSMIIKNHLEITINIDQTSLQFIFINKDFLEENQGNFISSRYCRLSSDNGHVWKSNDWRFSFYSINSNP